MRHRIRFIYPGDTRYKRRFLLIPKRIYDEWRWLETAEWEERYVAPGNWEAAKWPN